MLNIFCPHCGELRSEEEFHAKGQAHIPRPLDPNACSDEEWGDYMFFRDNPRGLHHELWVHAAGCRKYFNVTRHTVTYEILETYLIGEQPSVVADGEKKPAVQGEPAGARSIACPAAAASTATAR
ncbi:sarcosine oxidase subunit delta [Pseudomonas aeruginosa]|nr:sarcosine oxidase subunit delta [Pseudomonas aeruginosa]